MTTQDLAQKKERYTQRIDLLRAQKEAQTKEKIADRGYMDEDDYGTVVPRGGFRWTPVTTHENGFFYGAKAWSENFADLMERYPCYIEPADAIAGRTVLFLNKLKANVRNTFNPAFDYSHLVPEQELYSIIPGIGADAHFACDYQIGLRLGWGGLLVKVDECAKAHGPDKKEFFDAERLIVTSVQTWIRHLAEAAGKTLEGEANPDYRENLAGMKAALEWLAEGAPRTLREACQWIAIFNDVSRTYNRDGAGNQLDETLRPYYERDIEAGLIDDEDAVFLIACLLLNDPHYYQLGGPAPDGHDMTSHISYLILEAAHRLQTTNNLTIRVHDGLDEEFFKKSVRYLFEDRKAWPRYSGDKCLTEGFMKNGYSAELARTRIAVGCHWMAIPGREYTMNDTVKINVAKVFEVAYDEMLEEEREPSVAALWRRFEEHLRRAVLCTAKGIDFNLAHQHENEPELMMNLLCYGPLEKGLDASHGGVEMYNMCVDGSGLAVVADAFAALEQRIEDEGVTTWDEVTEKLRSDFAGVDGERVRLMLQNSQRYGQGGSLGDKWAVAVSTLFTALVKEKPTPDGHNMIPGWFSWSNTIKLGKAVGATPNGRHAHAPINHGANPNNGFRKDGAVTAASNAIASVQPGYGNTAPYQLEIDPKTPNMEDGYEKLVSLIRTHFALGGTLMNINVVDGETIREAHKDPSLYPDLVVRVTGFTAYFISLSPEFRQLVVDRILEG